MRIKKLAAGAWLLAAAVCTGTTAPTSGAAETDQFMTWGLELEDSADAVNRYFNETLETYLDRVNDQVPLLRSEEELTRRVYQHFFGGLFSSTLRSWLNQSPEVDRHPEDDLSDWDYQQQSILRGPHFPFVLPMAQTVRIGEVYFGIDKIGHVFGFGRRYYQRYHRYIAEGATPEEAEEQIIQWGFYHERYTVGGLVDGVFSKGDLEANYQGFLLAMNLCGGETPYIVFEDGRWRMVRPIDLRDYITPGFDESYNVSIFTQGRWSTVRAVLLESYCSARDSALVQTRFARYAQWTPSKSQRMLETYVVEAYPRHAAEQDLESLCHEGR